MTRRAAHAPRGPVVVAAVMRATFEELGRVGYAGLRIEDVAERAGVNKTTVYRRWPTKEELVTTAILGLNPELFVMPDTGSLRGDLLVMGQRLVRFARTMEGRAILRIALFEGRAPQMRALDAHFRARSEASGLPAVVNRALARREVPATLDAELLSDALGGALICKALSLDAEVEPGFVEDLVDALLSGMLGAGARTASRPRPVKRGR